MGNTGDKFLKRWFICWLAPAENTWDLRAKIEGIAVAQVSGLGDGPRAAAREAIAAFRERGFH